MMETQAPSTTNTTTQTPLDRIEIPRIQVTKDYAQFKIMGGNRTVDYNHVKRLKREMQANPQLLASNPIQVNEHLFILDGQHRRMAAQELGLPLYYIVTPGLSLNETRVLNVTQRRWTLLDFARSYAESGRQDYKIFLRIVSEHPKIAPSILRTYLAGGQRHQLDADFRRGEFHVENLGVAENNIGKLSAIIAKTHIQINAPMAHALLQLFNDPDNFNYDLFLSKLDREAARDLLRPAGAIRACLRSIEDVYNFQSKVQKRLY